MIHNKQELGNQHVEKTIETCKAWDLIHQTWQYPQEYLLEHGNQHDGSDPSNWNVNK